MYASGVNVRALRHRRPESAWRRGARRAGIAAAVLLLLTFSLATAARGSAASGYQTVTVEAGDTIWALAAERYPGSDTRQKVDEIRRLNRLTSPLVYPGEVLRLPAA
jgi:LysM repeat protein